MTQSNGAPDDELLTKDEVLQTLDNNDGKPHVLLQNQQSRDTLAQWKHEPLEYDFSYESVMETINWRGVEMRKTRFESLVDEVIESSITSAKSATNDDEGSISDLSAREFAEELNLDAMDDRERAMHAYNWIKENIHVRGIAEEQPSEGDLLCYENGTWIPDGETTVAKSLNRLLGRHSAPSVTNMVTKQYLKVEDATNVSTADLGLNGGYIALNNGLFDLQAGEIVRELRPEDYATTIVPWDYDPDAKCPTWEKFIRESVEPGKQKMIQEYAGYCLYRGEYPYAKALMLLGQGRNGKSVFLDTLETMLGHDNVMNADLSELAGERFTAYRLEGKLANINADIEGGKIEAISMFKNMTGGDAFQVEQKYGDPYDHKNTAKLLFAANEIPEVDTNQEAFYRRWLLVTFPRRFTLDPDDGNPNADPRLNDKLENEIEGILVWAVDGLQRLIENNGIFTNQLSPEEVREQWYSYSNPLDMFCRACLVEDPAETVTPTATIYDAYRRFMEDMPTSPVAQKQLTAYIKQRFDREGEHGVKKVRTDDGERKSVRAFGSVHLLPEYR